MTHRLLKSLLLVLGLLPLGAAAAGEGAGFLDPAPATKPLPDSPEILMWEQEGFDRGKYDKLVIEPITVFVSPKSEYQGVTASEIAALTETFRAALVQSLEPAYPVVDVSDARTLVVRLAITEVSFKKKERGLLGYTPIGFVATAAADAAGKRIELAGAQIEGELLDGSSGKRLQAFQDTDPFKGSGGKDKSWATIEARFKFYAERFRKRMDDSRHAR